MQGNCLEFSTFKNNLQNVVLILIEMSYFSYFCQYQSNFLFIINIYIFFILQILPIIVYFSAFTYVLFYLGWMQVVINKVAWILQVTMGITMPESLNIAGNIFLGQVIEITMTSHIKSFFQMTLPFHLKSSLLIFRSCNRSKPSDRSEWDLTQGRNHNANLTPLILYSHTNPMMYSNDTQTRTY